MPLAGPGAHLPTLSLRCCGLAALLEGWSHIRTFPGVLDNTPTCDCLRPRLLPPYSHCCLSAQSLPLSPFQSTVNPLPSFPLLT